MRTLVISFLMLFIASNSLSQHKQSGQIVFVTSNQETYGNSNKKTANHFGEIVLAYDVFVKHGYSIDFISPNGGAIPIGYISESDSIQNHYLNDTEFMKALKNTFSPADINPSDYDAVYYSGGGSAMFGIADNTTINSIAEAIYRNNGIISAVCHGTAGITNLKTKTGEPLYRGKQISGYPDIFENKDAAYYKTFPFSIEEKIKQNKGEFRYSEKKRDNFYIVDGQFITGQDPSSTVSVATQVVKTLQNQ